jgi:hypothetical protein
MSDSSVSFLTIYESLLVTELQADQFKLKLTLKIALQRSWMARRLAMGPHQRWLAGIPICWGLSMFIAFFNRGIRELMESPTKQYDS